MEEDKDRRLTHVGIQEESGVPEESQRQLQHPQQLGRGELQPDAELGERGTHHMSHTTTAYALTLVTYLMSL